MKIENVTIKGQSSGKLLCYADVTFSLVQGGDGCLTINGIKLFNGQNGYFVDFPSKEYTNKDGEKKYAKHIFVDYKKPEGDRFLKYLVEEVSKAYAASGNNDQSGNSSDNNNNNNNNNNNQFQDSDNIPW